MTKFAFPIKFQDLLKIYPSQANGKFGLLVEAQKGLQPDGSICPGGYENSLESMLKDVNRGGYHANLGLTDFPRSSSVDDKTLNANHELAFLQATATIKPSIDHVLGSNQVIFGCANLVPIQLPAGDNFATIAGGQADFDRVSWFTQTDGRTTFHQIASDFGLKSMGQRAVLIPGAIEQTFEITPNGYSLTEFNVSNSVLRQYILGELTKEPMSADNTDAYFKTLQKKLLPGFKQDAAVALKSIATQLDDKNTPKPYEDVLNLTKQLLEQINQYDLNSGDTMVFFKEQLATIKQLFAALPQEMQLFNSSRERFEAMITAIEHDNLNSVAGNLDHNLLPYLLQNHLSYITKASLERINGIQQDAENLHSELKSIVAESSKRPEWVKETAEFVLNNYEKITPGSQAGILQMVDTDFRYVIGYFNYLDWAEETMSQLQSSLPETIFQAMQQKIADAKQVDLSKQTDLAGNDRAWIKPFSDLHACFSNFVCETNSSKTWSSLTALNKLPEDAKKHFLECSDNPNEVDENVIVKHLKTVNVLGYLFETSTYGDDFDKDFNAAMKKMLVAEGDKANLSTNKAYYMAAIASLKPKYFEDYRQAALLTLNCQRFELRGKAEHDFAVTMSREASKKITKFKKPQTAAEIIDQFNIIEVTIQQSTAAVLSVRLAVVKESLRTFSGVLPKAVFDDLNKRINELQTNFDESNAKELLAECNQFLTPERLKKFKDNRNVYSDYKKQYQADNKTGLAQYCKIINLVDACRKPTADLSLRVANMIVNGTSTDELCTPRFDEIKATIPRNEYGIKNFVVNNQALFEKDIMASLDVFPELFGFTAEEITQIASSKDLVLAADTAIEAKVTKLAKESGMNNPYYNMHYRQYYNQTLIQQLQNHFQQHPQETFNTDTVARLQGLNDSHYYREVLSAVTSIGGPLAMLGGSALMLLFAGPVLPATLVIGGISLSVKGLLTALVAIPGMAELMAMYKGSQTLASTRNGFFNAQKVVKPPSPPPIDENKAVNEKQESNDCDSELDDEFVMVGSPNK